MNTEVVRTIEKVSIIIPVFNGANYLRDAINSALNQTYKNVEVIVINDGSADKGETEKIALSYGSQIQYYYKENGGVATALNFGISKMSGEYFSWLSHDDMLLSQKLELQMAYLKKNEDTDTILFGNYEFVDEEKHEHGRSFLEDGYPISKLENGVFPVLVGRVAGGTLLFHRKHFDRIGLFREDLRTTQDYEFWFRLFRNQKTVFMTETLSITRLHSNQGSNTMREVTEERDYLYQYYISQLTLKEIERLFQNPYQFYCMMLTRCVAWGLEESVKKIREKIRLLDEPLDIEQTLRKVQTSIASFFPHRPSLIYIYGAGRIGKRIARTLEMRGICINGFIDGDSKKWGIYYDDIPCVSLEAVNCGAGIIVALRANEGVIERLKKGGYYNYTFAFEQIEAIAEAAPIKMNYV